MWDFLVVMKAQDYIYMYTLADKSYITIGDLNCKEFFEKNKKFLVQVVF